MRLLIKFPSRGRPVKLLKSIDNLLFFTNNIKRDMFRIEITADIDDESMKTREFDLQLAMYKGIANINISYGHSISKIDACNRGLNYITDWDIVLLMSDDMVPVTQGYDDIIRKDMLANFPDTDGILYYPDGYTPLNTMCILGKKYYDRFGYIYHPDYVSLWCDNEYHLVGDILGKQYHSNKCLFKHEHPIWTGKGYDEVYKENDKYYHIDEATFKRRQENNFDLINTDSNNN